MDEKIKEIIENYPNICSCKRYKSYALISCPIHGISIYKDIQILLSHIVLLESQKGELEKNIASKERIIEGYIDKKLALQEKIEELETSMILHFQKEHLEGDGPEIDRWKRMVKQLTEGVEKLDKIIQNSSILECEYIELKRET